MAVDKQTLIDGLNSDLAAEYAAIIQYTHYAAKVTGPYRQELRTLFQQEATAEQGHAQYLADQISIFGGTPTTTPEEVPDADTPREMIQRILEAEVQAIRGYTERARQADELGEIALKVAMENQITDETGHKQEMERMLTGWRE